MSTIRKDTTNRLTLYRTCVICGQNMITTADTPFMRLMPYGGKKQSTCYFCSETCKQASYKHKFDGKHEERRRQKELARDRTEANRRYYMENRARILAKKKTLYWQNPEEYRARSNYNKEKVRRKRIEHNKTVSTL